MIALEILLEHTHYTLTSYKRLVIIINCQWEADSYNCSVIVLRYLEIFVRAPLIFDTCGLDTSL